MKKLCGICWVILAVVGCAPDQPGASSVDRVFVDGRVWTGDEERPIAQALAVAGDTIVAVGTTSEIRALVSSDTEVVDLAGRLVVPGFQDSHMHPLFRAVDGLVLDGAETLAEIQRRVSEYAGSHPDAPWITGMGWAYAAFPDNTVDRKYIDEIMLDRPVYLTSRDGHMGFGNSRALADAGITANTPDPPNGRIIRDASGEPTGELQEAAQGLVRSQIPPPTAEQLYDDLIANMAAAAAVGLTTVQDAGTSLDQVPLYERAAAEGALKLRVRLTPRISFDGDDASGNVESAEDSTPPVPAEYKALRDRLAGPLVELSSVKGMLDGTIDAKTAAMFEPYVGGGGSGLPFWDQDELNSIVASYDRDGFQVVLHAIGDRAINTALNAFEYARDVNGTSGRRHRVEHAELPRLSDLERFRELGVVASTQPMFAHPDATVLENFAVLLGPERAQHADSFSLYDDSGVVQVFGSDWPVFTFDVLKGIEVAVTRTTDSGTPAGGWYPDGRISVDAALRHYTVDAAYGSLQDDVRGTLAPGMWADFVVLSRDIFEISPTEISETKVVLTVMGGDDTYRSEAF